MESLVEQLNYYSKHGIPQQQQQAEDDNDEGNYFKCHVYPYKFVTEFWY
jgi:hypothetical protein